MNSNPRLVPVFCQLVGVLLLLFSFSADAAVSFNISPTTVSNTYFGTITVQATGLTNTETVVVQKYLDANNNGVIDPGELLVQQYQLTDGQASVFSGVTNYYKPGDLDPTPGAISTFLGFFPAVDGGDIVQQLTGKFLYKLSSPSGHFPAITNSFTVTNFPFAQTISGVVFSNTTPVPNAAVILFTLVSKPGGGMDLSAQAGTVADAAGNYSIKVPPGNYTPVAFSSGFVANAAAAPTLSISNNSVSTNLFLTPATQAISGRVQDTNNAGFGLPGIFVSASTSDGQLGITFTDTNGNFSIGTVPNSWKIGFESPSLHTLGYLSPQNELKVSTISGSVSGVIIGLPKEQALFFGSVLDASNNPLPGVQLYSSDNYGNYEDSVSSYVSGYYYAAALTNAPWGMYADTFNPVYMNYIFSFPTVNQNGGTNLVSGQALQVNFLGLIATNTISGSVKDNNNIAITNVQVFGYAMINGTGFQQAGNTDNNGNYSFNVASGVWTVNVSCGGGDSSLPSNYQCPNSVTVTNTSNNKVANFIVQPCSGIQINTTNVPVGEVNAHYDQFLYASSCSGNFIWTNLSGSLPPGVMFTGNGELIGTPTTNGVFTFTAKATDNNNLSTNQQISVTIFNAVYVTTTALSNATNGLFYNWVLQANNGVPFNSGSPYQWSLSPGSASLPPNLSLNGSGVISGTPATNGTFNFSVRATDALGGVFDRGLSLFIASSGVNTNPPPPLTMGATANGQIYVLYPTAAGQNFALQMTTNLTSGTWVPVTNGVPATALLFTNNQPAVFYRLH